mgnify:CR=1 FL=1
MNIKELYTIAKRELGELSPLEDSDFRLEQAVYNENEKVWEIVVSYLVENTNRPTKSLMALTTEFPYHRIYKKVKINDAKEIVGFFIFNAKE